VNFKHQTNTRQLLSWDNGRGHTPLCYSKSEALGVGCTCKGYGTGEPLSPVDHAWATVPRDEPGGTPAPHTPLLRVVARRVGSLVSPDNIATAACCSVLLIVGIALLLQWYEVI
jgi:hypothetical protein